MEKYGFEFLNFLEQNRLFYKREFREFGRNVQRKWKYCIFGLIFKIFFNNEMLFFKFIFLVRLKLGKDSFIYSYKIDFRNIV